MRAGSTLTALLAVAALASPAGAQSRISPGSMPSVERLAAEIKGTTPIDTAARLRGACWQLQQVIQTLAGPRFYRAQMTPEENRMIGEYGLGYQRAGEPYLKLKGTPEWTPWYRLHAFYETDQRFLNELLERFLPPSLREEFLKVKGIQDAQWLARYQAAQRGREQAQATVRAAASPQPSGSAPAAPGTPDGFLREAYAHRAAGDFPKVLDAARKAVALNPSSAEAHFTIGHAHHQLGKYQDALPSLKEAVRLAPSSGAYLLWLGLNYFDLKDFASALSTLEQAVQLKPDDPSIHRFIGNARTHLGEHETAIPAYRRALQLKPDDAVVYVELAIAQGALDEPEEAVTSIQHAVRLNPAHEDHRIRLALGYLELGRKEDAVAIQLALQKTGSASAAELQKRIQTVFPDGKDDPDFLVIRGLVSMNDNGRERTALPYLRRAILVSADPRAHGAAYMGMGDVYTTLKRTVRATGAYEAAAASYQKAISANPAEGSSYASLGSAFLKLGRKDAALRIHRRLVSVDPARARQLMAEISKAQ